MQKLEKWIAINDLHCPYQDKHCVELVLKFIHEQNPQGVVILGDLADFYQLSRFGRDPSRRDELADDLDEAAEILGSLRGIAPKARMVFLKGNHEDRLQKYLWTQSPELASLKQLQLSELLRLQQHRIEYYPDKDEFQLGDLHFMHGDIIRTHAGYTAKAMYDKHGVTLIHAHSHRDGKYTVRHRNGNFAVWENYCLCRLDPEYDTFPNWSQGFSVITMAGNRPYVEQIAIINRKFVYGGEIHE